MKYRKFVPVVPGDVPDSNDTGNMQNTPVEITIVPVVPVVPEKGRDTYTKGVCGVCDDTDKQHTPHTKGVKGGVLVSGTGNTGTRPLLQVVESVPGPKKDREQNREQNREQRPPLPKALWITGIVAFAEARTVQRALAKTYLTACGLAEDGFWYVASPSSGLTAKVVNSG